MELNEPIALKGWWPKWRKSIFGIAVLAASWVAYLSYDPWLRSASMVGSWLVVIVLLLAWMIFSRSKLITATIGAVLTFLILAGPLASFSRAMKIQNTTSAELLVEFRDLQGLRKTDRHIRAGDSWHFVYFVGDDPSDEGLAVVCKVTRMDDSRTRSLDLVLPLTSSPTPLVINEEWFQK